MENSTWSKLLILKHYLNVDRIWDIVVEIDKYLKMIILDYFYELFSSGCRKKYLQDFRFQKCTFQRKSESVWNLFEV